MTPFLTDIYAVGLRNFSRSARWLAEQFADVVKVAQRLGVGADQAGLAVGQVPLLAEGPDQGLGVRQAGPGHGRKEVVLDLVVEAAEGEVGQPATAHVAGGEHLPVQEAGAVRSEERRVGEEWR